jgi:hypothetical protein
MSKLFLFTKILLIVSLFSLINSREIKEDNIDKKDNKEKKPKIKWTTQELLKYTLKKHYKDNYFICDPLEYISEEEKEVIHYRLDTIYTKMNITVVFFILDKISLDGLNITNIKEKDEYDDDDDEFEDIVYKPNNTQINSSNITVNGTLMKTEEERQREFQIYIAEIRKKLFNRKIFTEKESKCLIGIFTVEDLGKYLYVGRDYKDMINQEEINYLLEGKDYLMEKRNLYIAVDNLFSNFLYRYSPSKLDKLNKFVGFLGEALGLGAIIFSYYLMNRKKETVPIENLDKKEEKKDGKKEEKKEEKTEQQKNKEKEKKE